MGGGHHENSWYGPLQKRLFAEEGYLKISGAWVLEKIWRVQKEYPLLSKTFCLNAEK